MKPSTSETIGERLRRLRVEAGLSQRDLQEKGISYAYISRVENHERTPSVRALRKLAPKLGVTPEYLEFGYEPYVKVPIDLARRLCLTTPDPDLAAELIECEGFSH